ncbi:MAG TPA: FtsX-like permease family protein, partial [Burkholderiales bacterium]
MAGVALGVALGFGVHLVNRAAVEELAAGVRAIAGAADLEVRGGRGGFPESLYPRLARLPGVAAASPALELDAGLPGGGSILVLGIDPLRAAQLQPALFAHQPQLRAQILRPDTVLLSQAAAQRLRLGTGGRLALVVGLATVELEVIGTLPDSALHGVAALADIATVQWRLDRVGELNRVGLRLAPGADLEAVRARAAALAPAGVHVTRVETSAESGAALSRAYRVNLNVLALVALVTGGFLVFSAQALEVARRRGEHALLRVLGLTRGALARLVLLEAGLVGAAGAALGLALGYGFAAAAVRAAGGDFGAGMFRGLAPEIGFAPAAALAYCAAGVAVALAGAALPAADAARAAPAQALKAGDEQRMFGRAVTVWPGFAALALSVLLLFFKPVNGIPVAGYLSIACLLMGGILFMPWFSGFAFRKLAADKNIPYALALEQLRGAPGQAMVSLAAIV